MRPLANSAKAAYRARRPPLANCDSARYVSATTSLKQQAALRRKVHDVADGMVVEFWNTGEANERHREHARDLTQFACRLNGILRPTFYDLTRSPEGAHLTVHTAQEGLDGTSKLNYALSTAEPEVWIEYYRQDLRGQPGVGSAQWSSSWGNFEWSASGRGQIEEWMRERIGELVARDQLSERWQRSTERLLGRIEELLSDRDRLEQRLVHVYRDLDVANARIVQLEAARDQLREERYGVKQWTSPSMLVAIATLIATIFAGIPAWTADEDEPTVVNNNTAVTNLIEETVHVAYEVIVDCGGATPTIDPPLPEGR